MAAALPIDFRFRFAAPGAGDAAFASGVALIAFVIACFAPQLLNDGDTFWHIKAGEWMLDHHAVLHVDPFSFTAAGKSWEPQEWLSEILMALCFRAGGWSALMLLFGAAFGAAAGLFSLHLGRFLPRLTQLVAVVLGLACVAGSLLARPHLLALPLLEIWAAALVIARSETRAPSFWLLPVMALWANLHGSFLFGLALIAPFGLEAILAAKGEWRGALRAWGLFAIAALAMSLLTPQGIYGLLFPFHLMAMTSLAAIGEWQATDLTHLQPFEGLLFAGLYVCLTRGVKLGRLRTLTLLVLLYLALAHQRHHMLFGIVAPLIAAGPLGVVLAKPEQNPAPGFARIVAAALLAAIALLAVLRLSLTLEPRDSAIAPIAALAHVPRALAAQPVLNDYAFGGYLIFAGIKPFIDSRADLYGDDFLANYAAIIRPDRSALARALGNHKIGWTMLRADNPAVALMDGAPGWHRLYADGIAVIHVRCAPSPALCPPLG